VAGAVAAPRLDLQNEDLVRAHVHAVWLASAGLSLKKSLSDILDVSGETPTLDILPDILSKLENRHLRDKALVAAKKALGAVIQDLVELKAPLTDGSNVSCANCLEASNWPANDFVVCTVLH
ncbi:MAG TPA: hypothetical protein PKA58_04050, partial [Polyangium sp.]|nr:hypothetical protein [Polyangium sp.]